MADRVTVVPATVSSHRCILGEGPHWDANTGSLYWIDILGKKVFIHAKDNTRVLELPEMPGCLAPIAPNGEQLLVATQEGIQIIEASKGTHKTWIERTKLETGFPKNRFNDGKVDPQGRFWVGSVAITCQGTDGTLYSLASDGSHRAHKSKIGISNGLAWSHDHKTMYYIDSPTKKVVAFDYDAATGDISNERTAFVAVPDDVQDQVPDGMTIDTEGNLWVAIWGGSKVLRIDPNTGKLLLELAVPALNVTSVCFGGENLDVLYVTSASCDTDLDKFPQAGFTFEYRDLGFKGFPMKSFVLNSSNL